MSPLRTGRVIPTSWSAHHQPVVTGSWNARCEVIDRTAGPPTGLGDDGGLAVVARDVPCRVQQQNTGGRGTQAPAGQTVTSRDYLIVVPLDVPVEWITGDRGHQIRITGTTAHGDPMLVGRRFDVVQVLTASEAWERDLICTDTQTQNTGETQGSGEVVEGWSQMPPSSWP